MEDETCDDKVAGSICRLIAPVVPSMLKFAPIVLCPHLVVFLNLYLFCIVSLNNNRI